MPWALLIVLLAGCDTLTQRRDFECTTEVKGKDVDVSMHCDYETGRESKTIRAPGG